MKVQRACYIVFCILIACGCLGCDQHPDHTVVHDDHDPAMEQAAAPSNRIAIPPAVRQNLGITFVQVEARRVAQTLRVPGRFEYLPTAKREYRTMLPGRVELHVNQYEQVQAGTLLYRIDSPAWRQLQQQLTDADASIDRFQTRLESFGPLRQAHQNHERQLQRIIDVRRERITQLETVAEVGGGRIAELSEAQGALAIAESDLAEVLEKEAELEADEAEARSELIAARANRDFLLDSAATLVGEPVSALISEIDAEPGAHPRWRTISTIAVHAAEAGVVESLGLTNGSWANEEVAVLTVVRPDQLRFRAVGLQSDLGRLTEGLPARIVAPAPTRAVGSIDLADAMPGTLAIGLQGDPNERTVDLFVTPDALAPWARAGISAQLEIVTDATAAPVLAIPNAAVQRDGLTPVFFRRDPADPSSAIRIEADLGIDDGRWTVVHSGLRLGDEVVLDGAFQLMLASASNGQQQGGHFHSDGTFHSGEHE
ncbi:MAG: hypothetical protein KDA20_12065 [Phycisphaerales bacterium]|nr:hypothetical protein [Phycisphaerales bacterium]